MNTIFPFIANRECNSYRPEIVVVGLQEIVELSATNVVGSKVLGDNESIVETWRKAIDTYLNKGITGIRQRNDTGLHFIPYKSFQVNQMVGIAALMFVLQPFVPTIRNVQLATVARGALGNVLGNKGGVCIRFEIESSSICFVISHLTAHQENISKRNDDYLAIITSKIFDEKCFNCLGDAYKLNVTLPSTISGKYTDPRLSALNKELTALKKRICALDTNYSQISVPSTTTTQQQQSQQQQQQTNNNNALNTIFNNAELSDVAFALSKFPESNLGTNSNLSNTNHSTMSMNMSMSMGSSLHNANTNNASTHIGTSTHFPISPSHTSAPASGTSSNVASPQQHMNINNPATNPYNQPTNVTYTSKLQLPIHEEVQLLSQLSPDDHDILIWMGDLNYRIGELPIDEVYEAIYNSESDINGLSDLYKYDQLYKERIAGASIL